MFDCGFKLLISKYTTKVMPFDLANVLAAFVQQHYKHSINVDTYIHTTYKSNLLKPGVHQPTGLAFT